MKYWQLKVFKQYRPVILLVQLTCQHVDVDSIPSRALEHENNELEELISDEAGDLLTSKAEVPEMTAHAEDITELFTFRSKNKLRL